MASSGSVLIIVENLSVPFDRRVWLEALTLREAGYRVSVICPKARRSTPAAPGREGHVAIDGIHIYRYPPPPEARGPVGYFVEFAYCWIMTALLSLRVWYARGFDVIHACNPPDTFWLLARVYKLLGRRFLFDHHDLSPELYLAKGGRPNGLLHRGLLRLERQTFRAADVVITTNRSQREVAMRRGRVGPSRIWIVRSGPDFERLKRTDPEPELKGGFQHLVCYLGEMCTQDGVDLVLHAARAVREELGRRDVRFVLMGGGPILANLKRLKTELGLDAFVEFTGRVSDRDLCRYLSTADVCLDPDAYTEWADRSTMNKIMEYMAFGKPIVAFDLTEHRFSAGGAAVYARPNDVREFARLTVGLLDDEEKRRSMGRIGLRRVCEELSWDYSKPPLLDAYRRAFGLVRPRNRGTATTDTHR